MKTEWYTVKIVVINLIVAYLWIVMNLGQLVVGQGKNFLNDSLKYAIIAVATYVLVIKWHTVKNAGMNPIVVHLLNMINKIGQLIQWKKMKCVRGVLVNCVMETKWHFVKIVDMNLIVERLVPVLLVLAWQINMIHVNVIIVAAHYVVAEKNPGQGQVFRRENGRNRLC